MRTESFWPEPYCYAVAITVNFDGESVERRTVPSSAALWGRSGYGRYGAQIGVHRLLDLFDRRGMRATFFIPGYDVERYPKVMERIAQAGHEVGGHGYFHEDFSTLSRDQQGECLDRIEQVFKESFGALPVGWRAPDGLMTHETRPLLMERGYQYDSSYCDDDFPYIVKGGQDRYLVEIPCFDSASDKTYYLARRSPSIVLEAWRHELAAAKRIGGLLNVVIHPRGDYGSGRTLRVRAVEAILEQIHVDGDAWVTSCDEIAEWTLRNRGNTTDVADATADQDRSRL